MAAPTPSRSNLGDHDHALIARAFAVGAASSTREIAEGNRSAQLLETTIDSLHRAADHLAALRAPAKVLP